MRILLLLLILLIATFPFSHKNLFAQANADCVTALEVCEKKKLRINAAGGEGNNTSEADFISCFFKSENNGQAEENSTWLKFEIAESGSLTFTITPHKVSDDIDFVVFRSLDGTCNNLKITRCNAAGDPEHLYATSPCLGPTGLRQGETDTSEDAGCNDEGDNAWLAPLQAKKGEKYYLLVSNVSSRGPGFDIVFGGTAMMSCEMKKPVAETKPVVKETPAKPTPQPAQKPTVAVQDLPPAAPPDQIGGRKVVVNEEVKVKNRKIKIRLWDSQVQDGDIVSVYLNDKKVIDRLYLLLKPQEFEIELPPGKVHYLTVYADDFGKAEPNSAMVLINDGVKEQTIDLVASRSKQESVKIVVE